MKVRELIEQLAQYADMDEEVYTTDIAEERDFDPYKSEERRVISTLQIHRRGFYIVAEASTNPLPCGD